MIGRNTTAGRQDLMNRGRDDREAKPGGEDVGDICTGTAVGLISPNAHPGRTAAWGWVVANGVCHIVDACDAAVLAVCDTGGFGTFADHGVRRGPRRVIGLGHGDGL